MPDEHKVRNVAKQLAALLVHKFKNFFEYLHQNLWFCDLAVKAYRQNVFVHLSVKPKIFFVAFFFQLLRNIS